MDRRREVSRRRPPRDQGRPGAGRGRLDAAQPEPPRSGRSDRRGHGAGRRNGRRRAGRAGVRPVAQPADPDPRRRGVPRSGRGRRDAEPQPAARLSDRRHDPHHRQQPAGVHDEPRRRVQHVVRERVGPRVQDPDRPRQCGRSRSVRRSGAARHRVSRAVPARFHHRPHRLPPLRPQRGGRAGLHAAADVSEDRVAPDRTRDLGPYAGRSRRDEERRGGGALPQVRRGAAGRHGRAEARAGLHRAAARAGPSRRGGQGGNRGPDRSAARDQRRAARAPGRVHGPPEARSRAGETRPPPRRRRRADGGLGGRRGAGARLDTGRRDQHPPDGRGRRARHVQPPARGLPRRQQRPGARAAADAAAGARRVRDPQQPAHRKRGRRVRVPATTSRSRRGWSSGKRSTAISSTAPR